MHRSGGLTYSTGLLQTRWGSQWHPPFYYKARMNIWITASNAARQGSPPMCANEGETCQCNGRARYGSLSVNPGAGGTWTEWQTVSGSISCSVPTFVDSVPGTAGSCQCEDPSNSALPKYYTHDTGLGGDHITAHALQAKFCAARSQRLCTYQELCPGNCNNDETYMDDGHSWIPYSGFNGDYENDGSSWVKLMSFLIFSFFPPSFLLIFLPFMNFHYPLLMIADMFQSLY